MKKFILMMLAVFLALPFGFSQSRIVISENFDGGTQSFTVSPSTGWERDTLLSVSGRRSMWGIVPNAEGDSVELISPMYDLSNYAYAYLRFSHICKISDSDAVSVEFKEDFVGAKWTKIPVGDYKGTTATYRKTSCFHQSSYVAWKNADMMAKPDNSWWKTEAFDVSQEVSFAKVQFKFKIKKGSSIGTNFAWGWFIDNFELTAAVTQIAPPVVALLDPVVSGQVYGAGPYEITAKCAKRTLLALQNPVLRYKCTELNGQVHQDSMLMRAKEGDSIWVATIPQQKVGTQVSYTVYACDTAGNDGSAFSSYQIGREWGFDSNCVALIAIDTSQRGALAGKTNKVVVDMQNRGLKTLSSADINWSVNGVQQSTYHWKGSLIEGFNEKVAIGTFVARADQYDTIVAWVSNPNGVTNTTEDTMVTRYTYGCNQIFSGSYTVGASGNFKDIQSALDAINLCGTGGNVILNVASGTYIGGLDFTDYMDIIGPYDQLTIQSSTGKPEDVVIMSDTANPTSSVAVFSNAHNITLRNLTMKGMGTAIPITDTNSNITIEGCRIYLDTETTMTYAGVAIDGRAEKIRIINNYIEGAYYGLYTRGTSATQKLKSITLRNNDVMSSYFGTYYYYTDFDYVCNNRVYNRSVEIPSASFHGIYMGYCDAEEVSNNRVWTRSKVSGGLGMGMYIYYFNQDSLRRGLVANNEVIYNATGTAYGIYTGYSECEFVNNSVLMNGSGASRAVYCNNYTQGMSMHFYNNNFVCYNGGYPMYFVYNYYMGTDILLDYNNCYGNDYIGYIGSAQTTLSGWQTISLDANATNINPTFKDPTVSAVCLHYNGLNCPKFTGVDYDINDTLRTSLTTLGCYSETPKSFDAALIGFYDLKSSYTMGVNNPLYVILMNSGSKDTLKSCNIQWTVNGVAQTPMNWNGILLPFETDTVYVGTFQVVDGALYGSTRLAANISMQNGMRSDMKPFNDSIKGFTYGCQSAMAGTYTIGGTSANFATLDDAIIALSKCGMGGPVELQLASGEYNDVNISTVFPGSSFTNRVTIVPASGIKGDVIIKESAGTDALTLNGAAHLHFKHLVIGDTATTANGVVLAGTGTNLQFYDCDIYSVLGATSSSYNAVYRNSSATLKLDSIKFFSCLIRGGYYNVYMINAGTSSNYGNMTIDSCQLLDAYYSGYFGTSVYNILTARHNYIHNAPNSTTYYGFRFGNMISYQSIDSLKGNKVWCNASGTNYGLYVGQMVNYSGQLNKIDARIWNNEFIVEKGSSTNYGFYYGNMSYMDWRHNTFYVSGSGTHYGVYNTNTSQYSFNFYDNLVYVAGTQGTAACFQHSGSTSNLIPSLMYMDYNVYYNEVNGIIGNSITDIKTWSSIINNDYNSLYERVFFKDIPNYNFHTSGVRGIIPVDAQVDIDLEGKLRLSYTNAGCYNDFIPSNYDAGVLAITAPTNGETIGQTASCKVKVCNMGKEPMRSVVINWMVNGTLRTPYKWSAATDADTVSYGETTPEITVGTFTVPAGRYEVVAWTENPNGFSDLNKVNDTAKTSVISCTSPLSGTYTVGGTNADYPTLEDAATALLSCGISSSVVMKIATGDYPALTIDGNIPGADDTTTVTFTSAIGSAEAVTIGAGSITAMKLANTSHLYFEHVTVGTISSSTNVAVEFKGFVEDVFFHHCNLYASNTATNSSSRVVSYANTSNTTKYLSNVRFIGNEIRGGYHGLYLYYAGGAAANCKPGAAKRASVLIDSNYIYDQYYYPLYSYYYTYIPSCSYNVVKSRAGASSNYGLYFYYYNLVDKIVGNRININVSSYAYSGIRLYYYTNYPSTFGTTTTEPVLVADNEIVSIGGTTSHGIYAYYYVNANILHNSVYCKAPTNYGIYTYTQSATCNLNVQNNIFMLEGGATTNYFAYVSATATLTSYPTVFDYNDYYTTNTGKNTFYVAAATTYANWQSTYGMDGHSVSVRPGFKNLPNDLSIGQFSDLLKCNRQRMVPTDINGESRTSLTVMGAYSTPLFEGNDLQVEAYAEPVVGGIQCFQNATPVKLTLYNMGTSDVDFASTPAKLYLKCESDSVNFTTNISINQGGLGVMKRGTFEVIPNMDITYPGLYKLTAWLEWSKDELSDDDTLRLDYYVDKTVLPYDNDFTGTFAGVATNQAYGDISWGVTNSNPVLNPVYGTGSLLFRSSEARGSISHALFTSVSLQGTYNPQMYFWYAHDNANPYLRDQMEVRISQDGGATFKTLQTLYRYDAKCTQPTWKQYQIDLSPYRSGSCIIIAFTGYSYGGGDQTVDRVKIIDQQDMQVLVDVPSDTDFAACNLTGRNLTVYLENLTSREVPFSAGDSLTVMMSGASNFVYKQALSGRLENREIDTLVLSPIDYVGGGQFDVMVYVNAIDSNASNDTAKFSLILNPDLAVSSVDAIGYKSVGDTVVPGMTLVNKGNLDIVTPFDVYMIVNGEDTLREVVSQAMKAGDTLHYTFSQSFVVPATTADQLYYMLSAQAVLPCDANDTNNERSYIGSVNVMDMGILSITNPVAGECSKAGDKIAVEVRLYNNASYDCTDSVTVTAEIDSAGVVICKLTERVAPLYMSETRNYVFNQKYTVPYFKDGGVYNVTVYLDEVDGDIDLSNDTAVVEGCVEKVQGGGIGVREAENMRWTLGQNQPNPAGNVTRIPYNVPEEGTVVLSILSVNGQVLYREELQAEAGSNEVEFNVSDLSNGIYYYSMEYQGQRIVRKMNVAR